MDWTENNIEEFIKENKDKFDVYNLKYKHEDNFIRKLSLKFKKFINIMPYLLKVMLITIIVFIISIWTWNSYIRKDRHEITLKEKIINIVTFKK